jgi:hypothetical protein
MRLVTPESIEAYLENDNVDRMLDQLSEHRDEELTSQRWLRSSPAKRMIYESLYGDLLAATGRVRVLDVGGGLTAITRRLASAHDYILLDFMAHEHGANVDDYRKSVARDFIAAEDWYQYESAAPFDLVIANDLFPNVDQRLELFLDRFLPVSKHIRLSLTYYNEPRFYKARRVDAQEILCMLSWNGPMTKRAIERFTNRIHQPRPELLESNVTSVFDNGRQVCLVQLRGNV